MILIWSEKYSKPNRVNCQVQVTVVQLANTEWFFHLPLQAAEIEVKDPNFFIETFLSPFKHCILTFEFKAWMKNCNHDPSFFGGEAKDFCWTKLYNLCKYTRENEMLANNNWGEIWSHILIRALQILETGPRDLEESWLLLTGKFFLILGSCIGLPYSRFSFERIWRWRKNEVNCKTFGRKASFKGKVVMILEEVWIFYRSQKYFYSYCAKQLKYMNAENPNTASAWDDIFL